MATEGAKAQQQLFELIKHQLGPSASLVDTIADLLGVSNDSAYRRLRGETLLNIDEMIVLCKQYKLSLDCLQVSDVVHFRYKPLPANNLSLKGYLDQILDELHLISGVDRKHITFTAEDCPIFHYFKYDLLTAFKLYYWDKSIVNSPRFNHKKFNPKLVEDELLKTAKSIHEVYEKIPCSEIWDEDTLDVVLKQIQFYWESGLFEEDAHALDVCDQLTEMLKDIQLDAELGTKERNPSGNSKISYTLYRSEVTIGNNCIQVCLNDTQHIYFSFNTLNTMSTSNYAFCQEADVWIKNLIAKSTQISQTSEKMRHQFFNALHKRVNKLKDLIAA